MAQAKFDENSVPTLLATLDSDGTTPVAVQVNSSNHALKASDAATGSDLSGDIAARDSNSYPVLMGVSSVDGVTPTAVYADSSGNLLIKST